MPRFGHRQTHPTVRTAARPADSPPPRYREVVFERVPAPVPDPDGQGLAALETENAALKAELARLRAERAPAPGADALAALGRTLPLAAYVTDLDRAAMPYDNGRLDAELGYGPGELDRLRRAALLHPEDRGVRQRVVEELAAAPDGTVLASELRLRHRDGRWLRFGFRDTVLRRAEDGRPVQLAGCARELDGSASRERALATERDALRRLLALLPDACVVAFDADRVIRLAEGACAEQLGGSAEALLGRRVGDPSLPGYGARIPVDRYRSVLRGETQCLEMHHGDRVFELHILPVADDAGRVTGGLQVVRDVSERAGNEAELERQLVELAQANQELQGYVSSNLELEQFAYVAAHDLKQPIRTIFSFSQLLQRHLGEGLDADGRDYLGYIQEGALRMEALVAGLMTYGETQRHGLSFGAVDLTETLEGVLHGLATQIGEKHVQVIYDALPVVRGDAVQMGQLLQNLVSNAIKFNTGAHPEVRIEGFAEGDHWHLTVTDNGIGIPEHGRDRVFGIFKRLHGKDEFEGAGIGLAVCRKIVERHGGRIWFASEEGRGTTFHVTLPRTVAA